MSNEDLDQRAWELEKTVAQLEQTVARLEAALDTAAQWKVERNPSRAMGGVGEEYQLNVKPLLRALDEGR